MTPPPAPPPTWPLTRTVDVRGDDIFVINLHNRNGGLRPYWATITHGIAHLGEPGSGVYSSRTKRACIRKAMRTISRIASENARTFHVEIEER